MKKYMKKSIYALTCLCIMFILAACAGANGAASNSAGSSDSASANEIASNSTENSDSVGGDNQPITYTFSISVDGDYTGADLSGLKVKARKSDFFTLDTSLRDVEVKSVKAEKSGNKSIITFETAEKIENGLTEDYYPEKTDETERADVVKAADNAVTWQLDCGGWDKDYSGHTKATYTGTTDTGKITKGWTANGKALGTIDNDGTYSEMRLIAEAYAYSPKSEYKQAFAKAMKFLDDLQYPSGGFAQVYPRRTTNVNSPSYSDDVTFNDDAMAEVMRMLIDIKLKHFPFTDEFVDSEYYAQAAQMVEDGIDYILKSQITVNGVKTGWCAQHDPLTYAPKKGREYEPASISGKESVGIIKILLMQSDNGEAQSAASAAIAFYDSVKVENTNYTNKSEPYFYEEQGTNVWYRFYEIASGKGIFGDRDGSVHYDISEISEERRTGYSWAGTYFAKFFSVYNQYGYYCNKVYVVAESAINGNGGTINAGETISVS